MYALRTLNTRTPFLRESCGGTYGGHVLSGHFYEIAFFMWLIFNIYSLRYLQIMCVEKIAKFQYQIHMHGNFLQNSKNKV